MTFFIIPTCSSGENRLTFGGDEDFPPYSFMEGDTPSGFAVDLAKVLADAMDRDIDIKLMPQDELMRELENDRIDGLIGTPVTEEMKRSADFSLKITALDYAIFVPAEDDYIKDTRSLEGRIVAVPRGGICPGDVKKNLKIDIIEAASVPEALEMVKTGVADVAICEKHAAFHFIRKNDIQGLKIVGSPVVDLFEYALAVKKGREPLLQEIDKVLAGLGEDGTIHTLKRKWFGITIDPTFPWKKVSMIIGAISGVLILLLAGLWVTSLNAAVEIKTHEIRMISRKMQEKDKLAVIGKLAGQIAHELKNPLSIINGSVFLLRRDGSKDPVIFEKRLSTLENKVRLIENILDSILSASSIKTGTAATISVRKCFDEVISDIEVPAGINIRASVTNEDRLHVFMDFHQLYSIFRNLIQNSIQAMGEKGTITAEFSSPAEKRKVTVRISDNGPGLKNISSEHIFDLFSSTRESGSGLGLPISKSIAETNGGTLYLESTGHNGTSFVMELPCSDII